MLSTLTVDSSERISPSMLRVHFHSDTPAIAEASNADRYIKLVFPRDGRLLPPETNVRELRASLPADEQPVVRTYSVRSADAETLAVAVDFVLHTGHSVAAAWAESASRGDRIQVAGPGGNYVPDPEAHNLFVADDAGLPAALAGIEALPAGAVATLFAEVDSEADRLPVDASCELDVRWSYRNGTDSSDLVDSVLAWAWPEGRVRVFAHGERTTMMQDLRPHFREHGVSGRDLSVSGYWRRGYDEDSFQAGKRTDPLVRAAAEEDKR